jgi:hypothetical protein
MLLVCAGCRFTVDAIEGLGAPDDLPAADPVDLAASEEPDLGATDLATAPGDLVPDPCGSAPALGAGNVAAQCVIGKPPVIDGDLADWPLAGFLAITKSSAAQNSGTWDTAVPNDANSSARYFVEWDLSYLYVAVSVTDDVRNTPNVPPQLTDNDAVEVFVDGKHDRVATYDNDDWQLVYSADAQKAAGQINVVSWPAGTHEAWGGTSPSWTLEAAIPWSILGGAPTAPGRVVGFDIKLDDNDAGSTRDRDLVLFYDAPSGGQCQAPYCRSDAFGAIQLQGR